MATGWNATSPCRKAHCEWLWTHGGGTAVRWLVPRLYMLRLINESSPPSKLVFGSNRFALPPTTHLRLDDLDAPELDCLDLTQIAISSYGPTGLVLTHIDVNRASWGPDAWATLFVECGNLEVARFTKVEMEIGAIHPRQQPGQLRYLRLLQLDSCDSVSVSCALDMVNAPNLECLIIRAGEKNGYYGGETAVWRQIVDDAILKASLNRTPWTEDYLLRDTLWPHTRPRFTAFLGRSNRITDLLLIGHVDVMDNFLECLIGMPRNEALTHLKVAFFGVSVKPVNHSMFYIKRFIYHRHFNHGLRPVNLCLYGCGDPDRIFFAAMCNTVHLGRCLCETEPELTDEEPGEYETYVKVCDDSQTFFIAIGLIKYDIPETGSRWSL
ncbi:uncharacterized protein EI90DRAFT_1538544 [Cantharellus anzutake]|uniref:uncharacterized protein n=1 Tax=Cantharellus anzutake TaxID=1750568 RepID=UPI0019081EC2|nr:uncharacterized protein EI90DRAFT_1538544 [Cantharellus anzutake]KAF8328616.1 hypothetical protein EI90DRAFT_1538544 [Cantharellus anzutake]